MRMLRPLLLAGTALLSLAPAAARAQTSNRFVDSWFLGAKGGMLTFWTSEVSHAPGVLVGVETMITRSRVALYLSADEAMFTQDATFLIYNIDPERPRQPNDTLRVVGIGGTSMHNLRRYSASLYAFPIQRGGIRGYLGIGMALNEVRKASITGMYFDSTAAATKPCCAIGASLQSVQSVTSALFTAGLQAQLARAVVFGQATIMPENSDFLFSRRATFTIEGGIRYKIGPAHEGVR